MATEIQLRTATVKQRSIVSVLALSIVTLGIYGLFWYYMINKEMQEVGQAFGHAELAASKPTNSVLAITLGIMLFGIPAFISVHGTAKRIRMTQAAVGRPVDYNVGIHWLLVFFTGLWPLYAQNALNSCWETGMMTANQAGGTTAAPHSAIA